MHTITFNMNNLSDKKRRIPFYFALVIAVLCSWQPINAQQDGDAGLLQQTGEHTYLLKDMEINTSDGTISIPCVINMSSGLIEVVLCRPEGKVHESLLTTNVTPLEFQTALLLLGLDPVNELSDDPGFKSSEGPYKSMETPGDSVQIFLETVNNGESARRHLGAYIYNEQSKQPLQPSTWLFRGATTMIDGRVVLDPEITLVATYHDPMALMELNSDSKYNDELYYVNKDAGLKVNDNVKLIIKSIH